ncbi:hypothetical protein ACFZB9_20840 [Kitasatospora sp. NPDC008050]
MRNQQALLDGLVGRVVRQAADALPADLGPGADRTPWAPTWTT